MSDGLDIWQAARNGLAVIALLALLTWLASLLRRDASLVDRMWPVFIAGASLAYSLMLPLHAARAAVVLGLVAAWGLRLATYITLRNWGHGEDRRYQQIRARNQPHFWLKSLVFIFALQTVLAWVISLPVLAALAGTHPPGAVDALGIAMALFGLAFEAVGDAQMAAFKADPANAGRVMDRGLWRFTRHPNYFGEACFWWGIWLMAVGAAGWAGAATVLAPLMLTWLLLRVSGVRLLEQDIAERRPAYREYMLNTPAFVPWWPRRHPGESS